jgi:hypothetical protein
MSKTFALLICADRPSSIDSEGERAVRHFHRD